MQVRIIRMFSESQKTHSHYISLKIFMFTLNIARKLIFNNHIDTNDDICQRYWACLFGLCLLDASKKSKFHEYTKKICLWNFNNIKQCQSEKSQWMNKAANIFPSKMKSFDRISRQKCKSLIDLFINKVVNSYNRLLQVFTMYLDQQDNLSFFVSNHRHMNFYQSVA